MSADGPSAPETLPASWPAGIGRRVIGSVDSTNAEALRLAPGLTGPAWILAEAQTAGRGRRARAWVSPRGNFHATLVMRPEGPAATVALRSFAAALALREALVALTGLPDAFRLKWPNDVLLNGGKVAGILLESTGEGQGVAVLCVGIGVNLIAAPDAAEVEPGALPPVAVLAATGHRIAPGQLLDALAPAYDRWERLLAIDGFAPLRAAWLAHAAHLGQPIVARTGTTRREGRFDGIDLAGNLILGTAQGPVAIPAAEVFF